MVHPALVEPVVETVISSFLEETLEGGTRALKTKIAKDLGFLRNITADALDSLIECDTHTNVGVSADGLLHNYEKSIAYASFSRTLRPFGIQIFGSDAKIMAKATELLIPLKPDFIDINMGCPVKKVVKKNAGSALLKDEYTALKIVESVKSKIYKTATPLSVKIRSGWDKSNDRIELFCKNLENAGADIIVVHPRTRKQMFSEKSDWSIIKKIKENVSVPVVGNGDIKSGTDALRMFKQTGCDSIMIGRGIFGKPWLIEEIKEYLKIAEEAEDQLYEVLEKCPVFSLNFGENIDARFNPPKIFNEYLVPYYKKRVEQLHKAGKFCFIHMDGALKPLLPYINDAGFDAVEGATPLPQGDVTLEELKEALGDTILIDGIPMLLFLPQYSYEELEEFTKKVLNLFSPNLILGISDEISPPGDIEKVKFVSKIVEEFKV